MVRLFEDLVSSCGYEQGIWEYVSDLVKNYASQDSEPQASGPGSHDDFEDEGYGENVVYCKVPIFLAVKHRARWASKPLIKVCDVKTGNSTCII